VPVQITQKRKYIYTKCKGVIVVCLLDDGLNRMNSRPRQIMHPDQLRKNSNFRKRSGILKTLKKSFNKVFTLKNKKLFDGRYHNLICSKSIGSLLRSDINRQRRPLESSRGRPLKERKQNYHSVTDWL
jgi:hypothetical protein